MLMPKNNDCEISGKRVAVRGTSWSGGGGVNGYVLKFETNDKRLYQYMEKSAQMCIDIACAKRKIETRADAKTEEADNED